MFLTGHLREYFYVSSSVLNIHRIHYAVDLFICIFTDPMQDRLNK